MSTEAAPVTPAVLVTIIAESVLRERIIKILKCKGVSGYTISEVGGEGGHGRRLGHLAGYNTNIEIKTVVSPAASDDILRTLSESRNGHALMAFRQNVEALSN